MKKKTLIIDFIKNIKKTLVSYISIFIFVCLGIAIFIGIGFAGSGLKESSDILFRNNKMYDYSVSFPGSYNNDDIIRFKNIKGVEDVCGVYNSYEYFSLDENKYQAKIISLANNFSTPFNVEGTLPANNSEIALEKTFANKKNIHIGDKITFENNDKHLKCSTYKVTALVNHPEYLSKVEVTYGCSPFNYIPVNTLMFVNENTINENSIQNYNKVYIRFKEFNKYDVFGEKYKSKIKEKHSKIQEVADSLLSNGQKAIVTDITDNSSYIQIESLGDVFLKLRYTMALLFVVVGLLVCYSSLSRIVNEQSILIGTKKALGISDFEITLSYLMYSVSSCLIGIIVGIPLGLFVIEKLILKNFEMSISIDKSIISYSVISIVLICLVEILSITFTTYFSCKKILKKRAIELLQNNEISSSKKHFYERFKLYKNAPLLTKTIINNCFNEKRRVLGTLIGIIGITALVVCPFTMNKNIVKSLDTQYNKIQAYKSVIYTNPSVEDSTNKIQKILSKNNIKSIQVLSVLGVVDGVNNKSIVYYYIPIEDNFNEFMHLYSYKSNKEYKVKDGVYISEPYLNGSNDRIGDTFIYKKPLGADAEFEIKGFYNFYLTRTIVIIPKQIYEKAYNEVPKANALLINASYDEIMKLSDQITDVKGFETIDDYYNNSISAFNSFASASKILLIMYTTLSIVMALLVLLNLLKMFVSQKKKELIVLRINGYTTNDAKKYIYIDTIFLSIIGIILGLILGTFMGKLTVLSFESFSSHFINNISIFACVVGTITSTILIFIMSLISLKEIEKMKLTDIEQ